MSWLITAIIGHLLNAVAFVIDKSLLSSALKRSSTYAAMVGGFSLIVAVALPWVKVFPPLSLYPSIIAFGGLFVFALWAFFEALKRGEATRIVPIVGSLIPVVTFAESGLFLGERLSVTQVVGFVFLLAATWMLTRGGAKGKLSAEAVWMSLLSVFLFATSSAFGKYAYDHGNFAAVFILSRIVAGAVGLAIGVFAIGARTEIASMLKKKKAKKGELHPQGTGVLLVIGQVFGAFGFLMIHLSIASGSVSIVNALQAVQYGAIAIVAWFGGKRLLKLLGEERTRPVIIRKSLALILIAIGLALVA